MDANFNLLLFTLLHPVYLVFRSLQFTFYTEFVLAVNLDAKFNILSFLLILAYGVSCIYTTAMHLLRGSYSQIINDIVDYCPLPILLHRVYRVSTRRQFTFYTGLTITNHKPSCGFKVQFLVFLLKFYCTPRILYIHHTSKSFTFVPSFGGLLVIAKEHLVRQPRIPADLEPIVNAINGLDLIGRQLPAVNVKVARDALGGDALGDDAPALAQAPDQQHLLGSLALLLGNVEEGLVRVQRRVGGPEARVAGAVDVLGGVVGDELGRRVAGVKLDLVDGGGDLDVLLAEV